MLVTDISHRKNVTEYVSHRKKKIFKSGKKIVEYIKFSYI